MQQEGWGKIYRSIQKHWIWTDKPFSRGQAWIDLILSVNHSDKKILLNGELIEVKRGSKITSLRKLGEDWGWSKVKVKKFLEQLQKDNMINFKSDNKKTLVTIENYSVYQDTQNAEMTQNDQSKDADKTQIKFKKETNQIQKNTNKNDKEYIKNDKEGKERKEIQRNSLPPLSFPSPAHQNIFKLVGEKGYRMWFEHSDITESEDKIVIKAEDVLKAGIIKSRYIDRLSLHMNKKIEVI